MTEPDILHSSLAMHVDRRALLQVAIDLGRQFEALCALAGVVEAGCCAARAVQLIKYDYAMTAPCDQSPSDIPAASVFLSDRAAKQNPFR